MPTDYEAMREDIQRAVNRWPDWHRHEYEERAAIKEYMGGMSRAQAEFEAFHETRRKMTKARLG